MKVKANGTEAKDIALYFLDMIGSDRYTQAIVGKTIKQVKSVLQSGYTKQEIESVIDHIINKGIKMYSFGYVSASINNILEEIKAKETKVEAQSEAKLLDEHLENRRKVVTNNDDTAERNKEKARRFGVQSRVREKFNFDMFEEQ